MIGLIRDTIFWDLCLPPLVGECRMYLARRKRWVAPQMLLELAFQSWDMTVWS